MKKQMMMLAILAGIGVGLVGTQYAAAKAWGNNNPNADTVGNRATTNATTNTWNNNNTNRTWNNRNNSY